MWSECAKICEDIINGIYGPNKLGEEWNSVFKHNNYTCGEIICGIPSNSTYFDTRGAKWEKIPTGQGRKLKSGERIAVLTIGAVGNVAAEAIEQIEATTSEKIAHYDLRFARPLDEELLHEVGKLYSKVVTVEDGVLRGGVGEAVVKFFNDNDYDVKCLNLGVKDCFVEHGTPQELYAQSGYDKEGIVKAIKSLV